MDRFVSWMDERFPLTKVWEEHMTKYYAPKNFNLWYIFGALAIVVLVMQILTGIFLTMHYKPSTAEAFESVEYIMRDVPWGWMIRYMHSTGASLFFVIIYMHMFRALLYGSYRNPRELVWILGMILFVLLMAEAFMGYLLPWGNMSYWGAQVIISLFGAIPVIGEPMAEWIRGDFAVSDATLNRFFAFHVILIPLILAGLVYLHIVALHKVGSNNPDGIEIKANKNADGVPVDGIPFHPYYTVKDSFVVVAFLMVFFLIVFFSPEMGGLFLEKDNFAEADILQTPSDIKPLWYFTPFYSILRAFTWFGEYAKLGGVLSMGASIVVFFFLPWLDKSPVKSIRYKGWLTKFMLVLFVVTFVSLGYLGMKNPEHYDYLPFLEMKNVEWAKIFYFLYFGYFLLMPIYTRLDRTKPVPERVTTK